MRACRVFRDGSSLTPMENLLAHCLELEFRRLTREAFGIDWRAMPGSWASIEQDDGGETEPEDCACR